MKRQATTGHPEADSRGITPVVGIVLLFGIVGIASVGLFIAGADLVSSNEKYIQNERAEQSFIQLSHVMMSASDQSATSSSVDLDIGDESAIIKDESGSITVGYEGLDETFTDPISFGAIEYHGNDETIVTLEGGAVFKGTGEESRLLSSPRISYDNETNTLNYPIAKAVGEEELHSDRLFLEPAYIDSQHGVVDNKSVEIVIESNYWRGWEEYFVDEIGERGVIAEPSENGDMGTVTVNLGRIDNPSPFENAVYTREEPNLEGAASIKPSDSVKTGNSIDPIDAEITALVDTAEDEYDDLGVVTGGTIESGEYYAAGLDLDNDLVVDLTNGDVTLVVDGNLDVGNEFRVQNWNENELQIYTTGDLSIDSSQMCLDQSECEGAFPDRMGPWGGPSTINPEQLQVYGTSDFQLEMAGGTYFEGVIFAPPGENGSSEVDLSGNAYLDGSVVVDSVDAAGTPTIEHHDSLNWLDPTIGHPVQPPELTYLNLVYKEIDVSHD